MQCNKTGCRQQFHVTCAQALGLLCEEAGNYLDNVKYCGYCQHHYSKLVGNLAIASALLSLRSSYYVTHSTDLQKKGGNVKTIPPYKPIPADNGSSDSSPEKEAEMPIKSSGGKRKSSSSKSTANSKSKSNASPSLEINGVADDKSGSGRNTPKDNSTSSSKFTTSNFVETIVTQSESVFGHDGAATTVATVTATVASTISSMKTTVGNPNATHKNIGQTKSNSAVGKTASHTNKKRKTGARTPTVIGNENSNQSASSEASGSVVVSVSSMMQQTLPSNNILPTITEATSLSTMTEPEKSKKVSSKKVNSSHVLIDFCILLSLLYSLQTSRLCR